MSLSIPCRLTVRRLLELPKFACRPRRSYRSPILCILIAALLHSSDLANGQDMPLSDVLIGGEDWKVVADGYGFTDGATTDADGNFYFTDVSKGDTINKISPDGKLSVFASNAVRISGMQFGPDGKLIACQGGKPGKIVAFDRNGEMSILANDVEPNDLVVTARGGIYFTETGKSQVTYIAPGKGPVKAGTGPAKPNGITLSLDQETLAVSDYGGENVWVWKIQEDGSLLFSQPYMTMRLPTPPLASSNPGTGANPSAITSKGDGMATDGAGRYYVTSAVGLQMFDPTGRMGGVIRAPQAKPLVSVEFSGPELSYLYVCCGDKIYRRKTKTHGTLFFQTPSSLPTAESVKVVSLLEVESYCEGVVFDHQGRGYISWKDTVTQFELNGKHKEFAKTGAPNGHKVLADGSHLICDASQHAIVRLSPEGKPLEPASKECEGVPLRGPNDLTLDPKGGFYFTDPGDSSKERPIGTVHYVDTKGKTHLVASGLAFPNGIVLTEDGKRLLVGESHFNRILEYPVLSPGKVGSMRVFADLPKHESGKWEDNQPDGMCLDAKGNLYVAHYGMQQVQVLDTQGKLLRRYPGGNRLTSNVAFGGPKHDQLFITGSIGADGKPGALFRIDLGVRGRVILPSKE